MTYSLFLLIFLGIPLVILILIAWFDRRSRRSLPAEFSGLPAWMPALTLIILAVVYTTPWDNYLVATGVWYYQPGRVWGVTLGWVPLEEYLFFVLQTLLASLWLVWLVKRLPRTTQPIQPDLPHARRIALSVLTPVWIGSGIVLASGWQPGTYLGLILVWALPPIMLQLWFGAATLWRHRLLATLTLASLTLYLSLADSLAIGIGVWTIDPRQSLQIYLGGVLPFEEFLFFLATNTLVVFGMILALAAESRERARSLLTSLRGMMGRRSTSKESAS
jgi:lycopene cyclase domain-containing protein